MIWRGIRGKAYALQKSVLYEKEHHDGVFCLEQFLGYFLFPFLSAIYQFEKRATDRKEQHVERHGRNEHEHLGGDGIHP